MKTQQGRHTDLFQAAKRLNLPTPTMLEIGGYPHYENVASNYLAYFLDPYQPHGLGDLLLRALWEAISIKEPYYPSEDITIFREYTTDRQQRIDLLLVLDKHVIAIEHKVYNSLENDLSHYEEWIRKEYPTYKWHGVVLHAKPIEIKEEHNFVSLIHQTWWLSILEKVNQKNLTAAQVFQWYFLEDLLTTMKRIENGKTMDQESAEFLVRHIEDVENVNKIVGQFLITAERQMRAIRQELDKLTSLRYNKQYTRNSLEAWQGLKIVAFYLVNGIPGIECKVRITPKQCTIEFWNVSRGSNLANALLAKQFTSTHVEGKDSYSIAVDMDPKAIHTIVDDVLNYIE